MSREQDWSFWKASLNGERRGYSESQPHAGYYRLRRRLPEGGGWGDAVVIWQAEDGSWAAKRNGELLDALKIWTLAAPHAVSYEAYKTAFEGRGWPDQVAVQIPAEGGRGIGDNSSAVGVDQQFVEEITDRITRFRAWLKGLGGKITTKEQSDEAAAHKEAISKLRTAADKAFRAEKDPVVAEGKAIDGKWSVVKIAALKGENEIVAAAEVYLREQSRIQREEALETQRRADADRRRALADTPSEQRAPDPEPAPVPPIRIKAGTSGRGIALKTIRVPVVDDIELLKAFFITLPEGERAARDWAERYAAVRMPVPGVRMEDQEKVA